MRVADLVESANEFDDVATGVTGGETSPEVFVSRDDESSGIISVVNGTRTDERITTAAQLGKETALCEDVLDGNEPFEPRESEMFREHRFDKSFRFPFPCGCKGGRERETGKAVSG